MKVNFEEVSIHGQKDCRCLGCGKKLKRSKRFYQTLNPWNKTKQGFDPILKTKVEPRTKDRETILIELKEERDAWLLAIEWCSKCDHVIDTDKKVTA